MAAAVGLGLALVAPSMAAIPVDRGLAFRVMRDGGSMGLHRLSFDRVGDELHVSVDVDLSLKLAFVTLFEYSHSNREVWRDGRLVSLDSVTNDDGTRYWVQARATDEGLRVSHQDGSFLAPADIISTSWWNPVTVEQSQLLDSQRGQILSVDFESRGVETLALDGRQFEAGRFSSGGDLELDLWYAPNGQLAKLTFQARGSEIRYDHLDSGDLLQNAQR